MLLPGESRPHGRGRRQGKADVDLVEMKNTWNNARRCDWGGRSKLPEWTLPRRDANCGEANKPLYVASNVTVWHVRGGSACLRSHQSLKLDLDEWYVSGLYKLMGPLGSSLRDGRLLGSLESGESTEDGSLQPAAPLSSQLGAPAAPAAARPCSPASQFDPPSSVPQF